MRITFITPNLIRQEAVIVPASGKTKRLLQVMVVDESGKELEGCLVRYEMLETIEGVWIREDMLLISAQVRESVHFKVVAKVMGKEGVTATLEVEIIKDSKLKDAPRSPLEKKGWEIFYHENFQRGEIDWRKWSPYYLRGWTEDELAKADFYFEDGNLVITSKPDRKPWCTQDEGHRVSSIQSFERTHLHRFGSVTGARKIPDFEGFVTKYGYFEVRMRLPDTKDGSHFAWWMIGVQDDQHITAKVEESEQYAFGVFSNQTAEFDIVEQTLDIYTQPKDYELEVWRPVIHPNGSTDLEYLWVPPTRIVNSPSQEYHVYGFEWDEEGTKFYLDDQLVQVTDRSPGYRMMTLFSLYLGAEDGSCGMGRDRGIYPKEAYIDYFRVYKKKGVKKPTSIVINDYHTASYLKIPDTGVEVYKMNAYALDQFDKKIDMPIQWCLGKTIHGVDDLSENEMKLQGVWIDPDIGEISVDARARENQDIFLVAFTVTGIREVKHLKLSRQQSEYINIRFNNIQDVITKGSEMKLSAKVYDQYNNPCECRLNYWLASNLIGDKGAEIEGVQIIEEDKLVVGKETPEGTYIYVGVGSDDAEKVPIACCIIKVI